MFYQHPVAPVEHPNPARDWASDRDGKRDEIHTQVLESVHGWHSDSCQWDVTEENITEIY